MGSPHLNQVMIAKVFDLATVETTDHKRTRGFRIQCGGCGKTEVTRLNTMAYGVDTAEREIRFGTRKFEQMGWHVGKNKSQHRCLACIEVAKSQRVLEQAQNEAKIVRTLSMASPSPAPKGANGATHMPVVQDSTAPKVMTRDDRRLIFEKLNEVYVDEKTGYVAPWTDKSLATDLGVPQAWVSQIRDENFGPEKSNAEIDKLLAIGTDINNQIMAAVADASKLLAAHHKLSDSVKDLHKVAVDIERRITEVRNALR